MATVVEEMKSAGLNVEEYARGPFGKEVFAITVQPHSKEGTIRIWPGLAQIKAYPDAKYRQVVLHVDETRRQITRNYWEDNYRGGQVMSEEMMFKRAQERFRSNVSLPNGDIEYTTSIIEKKEIFRPDGKTSYSPQRFSNKIAVTARIGGTKQDLLVGFDEKYHFIAALPGEVKSVEEAHKLLKPDEATKAKGEVTRQGEWFFTPVSEAMERVLDEYVAANPIHLKKVTLERNSSHFAAQLITYKNIKYVCGFVFDSRRTHHAPIWFGTWHQVTRNKEATVEVGPDDATRRRMRRTWD